MNPWPARRTTLGPVSTLKSESALGSVNSLGSLALRSCLALLLLAAPALPQAELTQRLSTWLDQQQAAQGALSGDQLAAGHTLIDSVSTNWPADPEMRTTYAVHLLRMMGRARQRAWSGQSAQRGGDKEAALAARARGTLRVRLNPTLIDHFQSEVLLLPRLHGSDLRAGAALLLADIDSEASTLALLVATRDPERQVRDCAVESLVGRDSPTVHTALVELLRAVERGDLELTSLPLERHFQSILLPKGSPAEGALYRFVRERLPANDWHTASRAIAVAQALSDRRAAPPMIEAMNVWLTRANGGLQATRLLSELEDELERRSGRKLGQRPDRWRTWWRAVRAGETTLPSEDPNGTRTQASFFGLRPRTDRVVFVLDRSGSMDAPMGATSRTAGNRGRTRFDEASTQLIRCLEGLGEQAHFDVILFNDGLKHFRRDLVSANKKNLKSLARWISLNRPDGGTQLRPGVNAAMHIDEPNTLEADTVIVLCDGETAEGPTWVGPFIRAHNDAARVRFHAVQLGGRSDGTLEALCEHTDGDYIEIND